MNRGQAESLLNELLLKVDYDLFKAICVSPEDPEENEELWEELVELVLRHVNEDVQ